MRVGLLFASLALLLPISPVWGAQRPQDAVVLADPADPYHTLAAEISEREELPLVTAPEAIPDARPLFVLWVASPAHLSDAALLQIARLQERRSVPMSIGLISGVDLRAARDLWSRGELASGRTAAAIHASNPSGRIEPEIVVSSPQGERRLDLNRQEAIATLSEVDYLTFTGHGGSGYLRLDDRTTLRPPDVPALAATIVSTASCNTFRLWGERSIALAFTERGAAAYAGFAYSPVAGYLIGAYEGLPLRYSWSGFPIGHLMLVENRATRRGFARLPFYFLLGDPRTALAEQVPYRIRSDERVDGGRVIRYQGVPAGLVPLRIGGGAEYDFVRVDGVGAVWDRSPFYHSRLETVSLGRDRLVLVDHPGGELTLRLVERASPIWIGMDLVLDALDHTYVYLPQTGGSLVSLVVAVLALAATFWFLGATRLDPRALALAVTSGLVFGLFYGLYSFLRVPNVTVTSKTLGFDPLFPVAAALLVVAGFLLFVEGRSPRVRWGGVLLALFPAIFPGIFGMVVVLGANLMLGRALGVALYNYHPALLAFLAAAVTALCLLPLFVVFRRRLVRPSG